MKIDKVLIFNPFGIGDVLFTTPLIRNLKDSLKPVSITYICSRRTYPLLKNNIFLDKVFVFEKDEWRNLASESKVKFWKNFFSFLGSIKKNKFDVIFDLSMNSKYGFFFKIAGIKKRIGFNYRNRGRFLTDKIDLPRGYFDKHVARYCLELLGFLGLPAKEYPFDLFLPEVDSSTKDNFCKEHNFHSDTLLIVVCPGSGDSWRDTAYFKRWPKENFLDLCLRLSHKPSTKILLLGSEAEKPICDYIEENMKKKPLNLCGKITLDKFCQIISFCDLVITNDGGPFHIAQALKKKAVVFYGPVDEKVYGVYPDSSICAVFTGKVDCRPCYESFKFPECKFDKLCLRRITTDSVFSQIEKIISG